MRKLLMVLSTLTLCLALAGVAGATLILDTGPNAVVDYAWELSSAQWLAGKFTTTQAWNFGAMQGDIETIAAGLVNITIYSGDGSAPGTALFTKSFMSEPAGWTDWQGTTGYAGTLPAGDYWISFEVPGSSTFVGGMGWVTPPASPMALEAYNDFDGTGWNNYPLYLSARIEGFPVPVPGAVWLLSSGLIGLAGWKRKFKS